MRSPAQLSCTQAVCSTGSIGYVPWFSFLHACSTKGSDFMLGLQLLQAACKTARLAWLVLLGSPVLFAVCLVILPKH